MKKKSKKIARSPIVNSNTLAIEERLLGCSRKESEHIIYVGQLVEKALTGEVGAVIKALTAGRVSAELNSNRDGKLSPDRVLGRVEMANNLWDDLEQFVIDKDVLLRPITETTKVPAQSITESEVKQVGESYSPDF